ncbi:MAG TPA: type II secretion system F family protein [Cytophagaceae bacterium]
MYEKIQERRLKLFKWNTAKSHDLVDKLIAAIPLVKNYVLNLEQSLAYVNKKIHPKTIIKTQLILIGISALFSIYFRNAYLFLPLSFLFLWIPAMIVQELKSRAIDKYDSQMLEMIQIFAAELAASQSVVKALEGTARKVRPPLKYEFDRLVIAINSGKSPSLAFNDLNQRIKNKWLRMMSLLILMYYERGGDLLPHIIRLSEDIINEKLITQKNRTELATMRFANTVINASLPLFLILNLLFNSKGMEFFRETTTGRIALTAAIILSLASFLITQRITETYENI